MTRLIPIMQRLKISQLIMIRVIPSIRTGHKARATITAAAMLIPNLYMAGNLWNQPGDLIYFVIWRKVIKSAIPASNPRSGAFQKTQKAAPPGTAFWLLKKQAIYGCYCCLLLLPLLLLLLL